MLRIPSNRGAMVQDVYDAIWMKTRRGFEHAYTDYLDKVSFLIRIHLCHAILLYLFLSLSLSLSPSLSFSLSRWSLNWSFELYVCGVVVIDLTIFLREDRERDREREKERRDRERERERESMYILSRKEAEEVWTGLTGRR